MAKYISLPGINKDSYIEFGATFTQNLSLTVAWIYNNYGHYSSLSNSANRYCKFSPFSKPPSCMWISSTIKTDYFLIEYENLSWKKAVDLCSDSNGHLPYFLTREKLDKFIAFMKLSDIPTFEAIFIELRKNEEVGIICCICIHLCISGKEKVKC